MYKVKYNDKSYIVNSNDEKSAIEKVKNFRDNGVKNKVNYPTPKGAWASVK